MPPTDQPATPVDPQASLRAELLGQIVAAQFDLEAVVTELNRTGGNAGDAQNQLQFLSNLQRTVGAANPVALAQMRSEIAATVAASQTIAQQSRTVSSSEQADASLLATSARTRATVQRIGEDLFERKIFDPYLQFASEEEERAYRQREAERQEYIRRELAKGTPEGTLNANAATLGQVLDAGAHGADRSPEFQRTKDDAFSAYSEQRTAMVAAGRPTAEADGGGSGNDTVFGWVGNDHLFGNDNDDLLTGDVGTDYLDGEAGNDGVYGGDDADTLVGGTGNDWLEGGLGDDYFSFATGAGNDTINGFEGEGAAGGDMLYFTGISGFGNFAAVQAVTSYDFVSGLATINLGGGNVIYINGVTQALTNSDFAFA